MSFICHNIATQCKICREQWIVIQFHADLSCFKEKLFHLLPRASRVVTIFGCHLSSSSTAIRTVDTREMPHKRASYQFSVAGRQCRAQVCSLAQLNKRKLVPYGKLAEHEIPSSCLPCLPLNYYSDVSPSV